MPYSPWPAFPVNRVCEACHAAEVEAEIKRRVARLFQERNAALARAIAERDRDKIIEVSSQINEAIRRVREEVAAERRRPEIRGSEVIRGSRRKE
jgi:cytochrome c553